MGKAGEVKAESVSSSCPDSNASKLIKTRTIPTYCAPIGNPRPRIAPEIIAITGMMFRVSAVCLVVNFGAAKLNRRNGKVVPITPANTAT